MTKTSFIRKIDYISDALSVLKEALSKYEKNKVKDSLFFFAAEKKAEEIVDTAVAINQKILALESQKIGRSYRESFEKLEKLSIFTKDELDHLAGTANFRNRLAHDYMELDAEKTYQSMKNILTLYTKYIQKMKKFFMNKSYQDE